MSGGSISLDPRSAWDSFTDAASSAWDTVEDTASSAWGSIEDTWQDYEEIRYATLGALGGAGIGAAAGATGLASGGAAGAAASGAAYGGLAGATMGYQERQQREAMEAAEVGEPKAPARRAPDGARPDRAAEPPVRDGGSGGGQARARRTGEGIGSPLSIPQ